MSISCFNSECRAFNFVFNRKEIFICKHVKNWWYWFVIFLTWFYFHFKVPCSSQHRKTQRPNFSTQTVWNVWKPTKPIGRSTAHQCPPFTNTLSSVEVIIYRNSPVSEVFWSPANRTIGKTALIEHWFSTKIAIWDFWVFKVHFFWQFQ